ncbi:MAG: ABC transporter substrate-binding protein [Actinomycetota bacterium]|nr:ABC transporter substrate-binding protein [Actinomycetota bacterium]
MAGALAVGALACAGAIGGCGAGSPPGDRITAHELTIYASLPLQGTSADSGEAVLAGASLALTQQGGRIGRLPVTLRPLDDATATRGGWDPGQTSANARLAAADPSTVAYLGDLDSGASAVSIPVLERTGIPQVSPTSIAVGLTSAGPGASPGEPQKYYPTGERTFVRIVPDDAVQAQAQVALQRGAGCTSTYALDDNGVDGGAAAESFAQIAPSAGLRLAAVGTFDPAASDFSPAVAAVAATGADCVLLSASARPAAVALTEQLAAALPHARLFATASLAHDAYTDPRQGGLPVALDPRVVITSPALGLRAYPAAATRFLAGYQVRAQSLRFPSLTTGPRPGVRRPGSLQVRSGSPPPDAILGYEAMSLLLDKIDRASDKGRRAVRRTRVLAALFSTRDRPSVLGTYSLTSVGNTTARRFGAYRLARGRRYFWRVLDG